MSNRRTALGRGLGALIGPATPAQPAREALAPLPAEAPAGQAAAVPEPGPLEIAVDQIRPNPEQPRRVFDSEQLQSLANSIAKHGVLQPVIVRSAGDGYELVVGERRWRASQVAGLEKIPVVVSDLAEAERLEVAIVENVQRHDLNPMELAHAYEALAERGATQEQIGEKVGLDRSSISNHLRLLDLPLDVQSDVEAGQLSLGHAKALLQINHPERQRHLRDRVIAESLSVRETERTARDIAGPTKPRRDRAAKVGAKAKAGAAATATDPELQPLENLLRDKLQTRVRLAGSAASGRIEIEYFSAEDLDRITNAILGAI